MDPLVDKALDALSIVCNPATGIAHPLDESRAKELFVALHVRGIPLPRDDIQAHTEALGWAPRHAKQLAELAARMGGSYPNSTCCPLGGRTRFSVEEIGRKCALRDFRAHFGCRSDVSSHKCGQLNH